MVTFELYELLDILKILVRQPSVVSAEHSFFRVLQRELEESGIRVTWYEGLLVAEGNQPGSYYLSAHIDRHGLICTGPNEFQYAAFIARNRGDLKGTSVSEQTFSTISQRFVGASVNAYEPWSGIYRGQGLIERTYLCPRRGNMVFEIQGLEHVVAGTPVAFQDKLKSTGTHLSAQLDNVISAAVIIYLYRHGYQGTAFFTSQEEAGRSWRFLQEWFDRFDRDTKRLIVLDTSPYATPEEAESQHLVLRHRDSNAEFDPGMLATLEQACQVLGITYGFKDEYIAHKNIQRQQQGKEPYTLGSTELGRIVQASEQHIQGATLQLPTTGYHTTEETCSVTSLAAMIKLLQYITQ